MASQSSYIKHRAFLTPAFCWGMLLRASRPKRHALSMCSPRQGRSRRSVLYCVTCYFYLMLAFLGQMRSREQGQVSKFRALLPPLLSLPLFCLPPLLSDCSRLCQFQKRDRDTMFRILQSFQWCPFTEATTTKECHQERKTQFLYFILLDPCNDKAARNICLICSLSY